MVTRITEFIEYEYTEHQEFFDHMLQLKRNGWTYENILQRSGSFKSSFTKERTVRESQPKGE